MTPYYGRGYLSSDFKVKENLTFDLNLRTQIFFSHVATHYSDISLILSLSVFYFEYLSLSGQILTLSE